MNLVVETFLPNNYLLTDVFFLLLTESLTVIDRKIITVVEGLTYVTLEL